MNDRAPRWPGTLLATAGRRLSWPALLTYGLTQVVLLFWWAVYHPGLFSPDSLGYITQSTTGTWSTHHPITYTGLVWLSLQITGGLGALTGLQTVAMALALTYAMGGLRRLGVPGWLTVATAVVAVALPPVGGLVITVWKDVPFVICHVFLLGTLARAVARRRAGLLPVLPAPLLLAVAVEMLLICLFRQNGFVVVAIVAVACALLLRPTKRLLVATGAAAAAALLVNWALLPALGVRGSDSIVAYEAMFSDISVAYSADPTSFPAADTEVMARVAPLTHWRDAADCHHSDSVTFAPAFDRAAAAVHSGALVDVWWNTARRDPDVVLSARICRSAIGWSPLPAGTISRNPPEWSLPVWIERDVAFQESPFAGAVRMKPLSERAHRIGAELTQQANRSGLEWLMWRGATWTYVAYAVVGFVAWRRREPALLALATLSAGNQVSVLIVNNVQAARYMAAPYLLGVLLLPLLAARRDSPVTGPAEPPADAGSADGDPVGSADAGTPDVARPRLPRQRKAGEVPVV